MARWHRHGLNVLPLAASLNIPFLPHLAPPHRSGAKFGDPSAGDITRFGTASAWAAIAPDDDEEEEAAASAGAGGSGAPAAALAPALVAAAAASGFAVRAEDLVPGSGELLDTDEAVKDKCSAIAAALRLTTDAEEALRSVCELRCEPVGRRERIVDVLLQASLTSKGGEEVEPLN